MKELDGDGIDCEAEGKSLGERYAEISASSLGRCKIWEIGRIFASLRSCDAADGGVGSTLVDKLSRLPVMTLRRGGFMPGERGGVRAEIELEARAVLDG